VDDNAGPGVTTDSIQTAIDLASSGDLILVRPGEYAPFALREKSLTIQADGPGVVVQAPVEVVGPIPGDAVLDGLDIRISGTSTLPLLAARTVAGTLWLEDLTVWNESQQQGIFGLGSAAVSIDQCPDVVISDCTFRSGGLVINSSSSAAIFDTVIDARPVDPQSSTFGAVGLRVSFTNLTTVGCTVRSADGRDALFDPQLECDFPQPGGDGVQITSSSAATLIETVVTPGTGGISEYPCSEDAPDGETYDVWFNSSLELTDLDWSARHLEVADPMVSGVPGKLTLEGTPTELAWVYASLPSPSSSLPIFTGALCVSPTAPLVFLGPVAEDGTLGLLVTIELPSATAHFDLRLQPLFYSFEDGFVLGTPRSSTILGQGF
ncbi:MAG: right-handed parallel beta-helix repeat-containing protein, partial [Planctomycetota bacterium]